MYKGKAIYNPSGKAGEYAQWACNLYVGCSNDCSYCYCKRGVLGSVMGEPKARLKACFRDETHAFEVFVKELTKNADAIRKEGGLFFSFTTDPMLPETIDLTMTCVSFATGMGVPCQILTKRSDWTRIKEQQNLNPRIPTTQENFAPRLLYTDTLRSYKDLVAVGFSISGHDDLEPNADLNMNRIEGMKLLHYFGIKTFASFEPVVTFERAAEYLHYAEPYCDLLKFGLMSGDAHAYDQYDMPASLEEFVKETTAFLSQNKKPVFWKKSITDRLSFVPQGENVVGPNYSLFK